MFDIAPSELLLVAMVALVVIGPKDLPRAMRFVGQWVGRARGMARHFRMGVDEIIRHAELEEMEKKWAAENARIMAQHPAPPIEEAHDAAFAYPSDLHAMTPLPPPSAGEEAAVPAVPAHSASPVVEPLAGAPAVPDQMPLFATPPAGEEPAKPAEGTPKP